MEKEWRKIINKGVVSLAVGAMALSVVACSNKDAKDEEEVSNKGNVVQTEGNGEEYIENECLDEFELLQIEEEDSGVTYPNWMYWQKEKDVAFAVGDLDGNTCGIYGYKGAVSNLVVPSKIGDKNVIVFRGFGKCDNNQLESVEIEDGEVDIVNISFKDCKKLKSVKLPDGLTNISYETFEGCENLEEIIVPDSIGMVDGDILSGTKWYEKQLDGPLYLGKCLLGYKGIIPMNYTLNVKEGTKVISAGAFEGSGQENLVKVEFPDSLERIDVCAFAGCKNIESIKLSGNVTVESFAFEGCEKLAQIEAGDDVKCVGSHIFENTKWLKNQPDGMACIGKTVISFNESDNMQEGYEVVIKEGTKCIAGVAFMDCKKLGSVIMPDGVTDIGDSAFYGCSNLKSVQLPDTLIRIDDCAFECCEELKEITIPSSVEYIGGLALGYRFVDCAPNDYGGMYEPVDFEFVIHGQKGSFSEKYAKDNGFKFVAEE